MSNTIGITWTSDSRQVFEDYQKKQLASEKLIQKLQQEIDKMKEVGAAGKQSGQQVETGFKAISTAIQKIGKGGDPGKDAAARLAAQKAAALADVKAAADAQALRDKELAAMRRFAMSRKELAKQEYFEKTGKLKQAHASGELSDSEYMAGMSAYKRAYAEQIGLIAKRRKAEREAAIEKQRNDREATALLRTFGTEQDRHNQKIQRYRELLRAGSIDQKQFAKAIGIMHLDQHKFTTETDKSSDALLRFGGRLVGIATAYMSVTQAVRFLMQANKEQQQASEEAAGKQDELVRRFRAQGGLNALQGRAAKNAIYKAAIETATPSEDAFNTASTMVSTGFGVDQAQGPALTPFLKLIKAQSLIPGKSTDAKDMAESFSMFLTANKKDLNAQNVEELATQIQGLKETPLKVTDLQQLAKHSSALGELGGMSPEEQLANFAMLRKTQIAEEAGTHMREIVRQLATAKASPKVVEQLGRMGLNPEDVDFNGENFATVMGRIKKGVESLPEDERSSALDIVVEGRNISSMITEMGSQQEVEALKKKMGDKAGFARDVEITTTGQNATSIRQKTAIEMVDAAKDMQSRTMREAYELQLKTSGLSPVGIAAGLKAYDAGTALMGHEGFMSAFGSNEQRGQVAADAIERERNMQDAKTIIDERKQAVRPGRAPAPPPVNVNVNVQMPGQGEKPPPVPAAGLGIGGGR